MKIRAATLFTLLAALFVTAATAVRPTAAQSYRPWCAQYGGASGDSGTNCSFASYEQCMMTARGGGAYCVQNPWYLRYGSGQQPASRDDQRHRRRGARP